MNIPSPLEAILMGIVTIFLMIPASEKVKVAARMRATLSNFI